MIPFRPYCHDLKLAATGVSLPLVKVVVLWKLPLNSGWSPDR